MSETICEVCATRMYLADNGKCPACKTESLFAAPSGSVVGVLFAVSNDGGKTGVAWREDVHEAFAYLDLQNVNGGNYAVVAVRKPLNAAHERPATKTL